MVTCTGQSLDRPDGSGISMPTAQIERGRRFGMNAAGNDNMHWLSRPL